MEGSRVIRSLRVLTIYFLLATLFLSGSVEAGAKNGKAKGKAKGHIDQGQKAELVDAIAKGATVCFDDREGKSTIKLDLCLDVKCFIQVDTSIREIVTKFGEEVLRAICDALRRASKALTEKEKEIKDIQKKLTKKQKKIEEKKAEMRAMTLAREADPNVNKPHNPKESPLRIEIMLLCKEYQELKKKLKELKPSTSPIKVPKHKAKDGPKTKDKPNTKGGPKAKDGPIPEVEPETEDGNQTEAENKTEGGPTTYPPPTQPQETANITEGDLALKLEQCLELMSDMNLNDSCFSLADIGGLFDNCYAMIFDKLLDTLYRPVVQLLDKLGEIGVILDETKDLLDKFDEISDIFGETLGSDCVEGAMNEAISTWEELQATLDEGETALDELFEWANNGTLDFWE